MRELEIEVVEQQFQILGRQKVHDPRSRNFRLSVEVDRSSWRNKRVRIYDPRTNPNQCHGECTGCAKAMEFNAIGNRVSRRTLGMDDAHKIYSLATTLDPWDGSWPPTDTGSSGLASAKAAQSLGYGGEYRHVFGGADEIVQLIQEDKAVPVGTWWHEGMFRPDEDGVIHPSGNRVGGHMYLARGYEKKRDLVLIRCWWGEYRDVWIRRGDLNDLMMNGGDAHLQVRVK